MRDTSGLLAGLWIGVPISIAFWVIVALVVL